MVLARHSIPPPRYICKAKKYLKIEPAAHAMCEY